MNSRYLHKIKPVNSSMNRVHEPQPLTEEPLKKTKRTWTQVRGRELEVHLGGVRGEYNQNTLYEILEELIKYSKKISLNKGGYWGGEEGKVSTWKTSKPWRTEHKQERWNSLFIKSSELSVLTRSVLLQDSSLPWAAAHKFQIKEPYSPLRWENCLEVNCNCTSSFTVPCFVLQVCVLKSVQRPEQVRWYCFLS